MTALRATCPPCSPCPYLRSPLLRPPRRLALVIGNRMCDTRSMPGWMSRASELAGGEADRIRQQLSRYSHHLLAAPLPQRVPSRLALERCRFDRAPAPVQRSEGPGLRIQPRPGRSDHGKPVEPIYPFAPDSTIVRFELPAPLAPGASMRVTMGWDARPSTLPRRQGRRGRAYDFAQWYPKVVVYDKHGWNEHPVYPGGEFYGEFATFLVDLELPADEVMGATGVPLCGDPGWERANQVPDRPVEYQREYYPAAGKFFGPRASAGPGFLDRSRASTGGDRRRASQRPGAEASGLVCRKRPPLRHVHESRLPLRRRPLGATSRSMCSTNRETAPPGVAGLRFSGPPRRSNGSMVYSGNSPGLRSATSTGSKAAGPSFP